MVSTNTDIQLERQDAMVYAFPIPQKPYRRVGEPQLARGRIKVVYRITGNSREYA